MAPGSQEEVARLTTELQEALNREKAVSQILQTIGRGAFDLEAVLQTVIESAVTLGRADYGDISRLEEATGVYRPVAWHGPVAPEFWDVVRSTTFAPGRATVNGRALMEMRPVHVLDVLADPEYSFPQVERLGGYRSALAVPILRDGVAKGVIFVSRIEVRGFSDREISLLTTFADQAALAIENVRLFEAVERQRTELARFAPQVASLLSSDEGKELLAGHRRQITALFCDLRGFTSFAEGAEPEEVFGVLRAYHAAVGELAIAAGGTVEHFAGDGLMVFFNDPVLLQDHELVAVRTALDIRDRFRTLAAGWGKKGYELGLGIGVGVGYATLGRIGFEGRYDYGAVGNVVIHASRLSDVAEADQILVTQRVFAAVDEWVDAEPVTGLVLKGFSKPVTAFAVRAIRSS
jgi:class 3 adenylate cyclase